MHPQSQEKLPEFLEALAKGGGIDLNFDEILSDVLQSQKQQQQQCKKAPQPKQQTQHQPLNNVFENILSKLVSGLPSGTCEESACKRKDSGFTDNDDKDVTSVAGLDYEIAETESQILVYIVMKGVDKSSIRISYDSVSDDGKKTLNIMSDRTPPHATATVAKTTINYGKKALSLLLKKAPQYITSDDIVARFDNGVLHIIVPKEVKMPAKEPKYVQIT
jgi:HSP20 family molecular chaperone IbpA